MKRTIFCLSILVIILSTRIVSAEDKVYHWLDEKGINHFSDTAIPNAEEIQISNQNLLLNNPKDTNKANTQLPTIVPPKITYQASITAPINDNVLRSNDGTIDIQVSITPEKENEQKLQLFLDGKAIGKAQISTTIRALNIDRGTHQLQVNLLDKAGNILAKTQIITIHLLRASVGTVNAK